MFFSIGTQSVSSSNHTSNLLLNKKPPPNQTITPTLNLPSLSLSPNKPKHKPLKISSSSQTLDNSIIDDDKIQPNPKKTKRAVVVKPMEKPRLVLKFIWMKNNIGIALDQVVPGGHGTIPLSAYYFWPRKDAWEELRVLLESKQWISRKQMVLLLNQASDVINLWQESGGGDLS